MGSAAVSAPTVGSGCDAVATLKLDTPLLRTVDTQDALTYIGRMKERGGDGSQPSLGAESAEETNPNDSFRRPSIHDGKDKVKAKL